MGYISPEEILYEDAREKLIRRLRNQVDELVAKVESTKKEFSHTTQQVLDIVYKLYPNVPKVIQRTIECLSREEY